MVTQKRHRGIFVRSKKRERVQIAVSFLPERTGLISVIIQKPNPTIIPMSHRKDFLITYIKEVMFPPVCMFFVVFVTWIVCWITEKDLASLNYEMVKQLLVV